MRIAVYCSASTSIDQKYLDLDFDIGVAIAVILVADLENNDGLRPSFCQLLLLQVRLIL
jgi:hypothetical protein